LEVRTARELRAVLGSLTILRLAGPDHEAVATGLDDRLDIRLLARLRSKQEAGDQRYFYLAKRRVGAFHGAGPEPGDHRELLADERLQVRPPLRHLGRDLDLGIEVPDALLRLVAHPLAVVAHVLGQAPRAPPLACEQCLLASRLGVHRRLAGEPRWDLNHRLVDEHRHRVQVARVGLEPQPLRLERQRAAAGERVMEGRELLAVEQLLCARMVDVLRARPTPALPDLGPRALEHLLVGGVLPQHEVLDDLEETLALLLLLLLGGEEVRKRRRVVHHLCEDHRPRRRHRPLSPPLVKRGRVAAIDEALSYGCLVDGFERQRHLDELLLVRHRGASARARSSAKS
jgi:hypothetical protein